MKAGRLLITGASGFIGSHLLPLLARHYEIVALSTKKSITEASSVEWHTFNLLTDAPVWLANYNCDTLVHLAWGLPHRNYWTDPDNILWLKRSRELVSTFLRNGGKHVHIAGTCAEYDWHQPMPLNEISGKVRPGGLYGKCKNALRTLAQKMCANSGASLGWYRIFWPFGPNQDEKKFIPGLIHALVEGHPAHCRSSCLQRDYIHVKDVADLICRAILHNFNGILNVGSGYPAALGDIADKIAFALGREDLLENAGESVCPDEAHCVVADISAQKALGFYHPVHDLDSGIADTIQFICKRSKK